MSEARTRVLLVEDSAGDARLLRELLAEVPGQPFTLTTVATLAAAAAAVGQHDLVFLDLSLPDASGPATITRMAEAAGPTPIVVLTGNTDDAVAAQAVSLGAEDYLQKSELTPILLARTARYAIERRRGLEAQRQLLALEIARAESERSAVRSRFLADLSGSLATLASPEEILEAVVRAVVPALADVCLADLALDGGGVQRVASWGGTAVPAEDATLVLPLTGRDRSLGALTFGCAPGRRFDDDRRAAATEVAQRTAAAVDNALLHRANQRALRAREEMLAVVSHDLRNPLSVVSLALEALKQQTALGVPASPQLLSKGLRAIGRMQRLIDDLLDVARIDSGTLVVARTPLDLTALLRDAIEQHASLAADKRIALDLDCVGGLHIDGDRERLMQVLSNLIGNALKFTPAGGRVMIAAAVGQDGVHISVTDSGPGVAAEYRAHVFERFYQSSRRKDGVGLGLAIAKGIVDAHGGRIGVDGVEPHGARFWFELPRPTGLGALLESDLRGSDLRNSASA